MSTRPLNLTEFILRQEKNHPRAHGDFSLLMASLEYAGKIIASHVRQAGLIDILGVTGERNTFQDEVKKIDVFSNNLLIQVLKESHVVSTIGSEELSEPLVLDKEAPYAVFFDPLDGSSNIDINAPIGTIFSIYHNKGSLLQKGSDQVASGYIFYGASVMFVYTSGNGVNGFTLDPQIGAFLLSHPDIRIPSFKASYSINEGEYNSYNEQTRKFLTYIKEEDPDSKRPYKLRYYGAMIAEIHRILLQGGIFLHPQSKRNPQGKLRLMYEINPLSFVLEQAGGIALANNLPALEILPEHVHQQLPVAMGSPENIQLFKSFLS